MSIISPTVGRKVWYWPSEHDKLGIGAMQTVKGQPLDATVLAVWGDRCVNLLVIDITGKPFPKLSATLMQDGDLLPKQGPVIDATTGEREPGGYACWMPYQVGQAKKEAA